MLLLAWVVVEGVEELPPGGLWTGPPTARSINDSSDEGLDPGLDPVAVPGRDPPVLEEAPLLGLLPDPEGLMLEPVSGLDPAPFDPGLEPPLDPTRDEELLPLSMRLPAT